MVIAYSMRSWRYNTSHHPVHRRLRLIVKPPEVTLGAADAFFDQRLLGEVGDVEVGGAHVECVDVHRALPVIAVQVHVFLRVHEGADQAARVVAEVPDGFALKGLVVAKEADVFLAVQAQAQRLAVVHVRAVAGPGQLEARVLFVVVGRAPRGGGLVDHVDVTFAVEELHGVIQLNTAIHVDIVAGAKWHRSEEQRNGHGDTHGRGQRHVGMPLDREELCEAGGEIGGHHVQVGAAGILQVAEGGLRASQPPGDEIANPVVEEVALVPAIVTGKAPHVADGAPGIVHEGVEVCAAQDLLLLRDAVTQCEQQRIDGARTGAANAFDLRQDAAILQHLHRANIGDALHTAAFEHQVSELGGHREASLCCCCFFTTKSSPLRIPLYLKRLHLQIDKALVVPIHEPHIVRKAIQNTGGTGGVHGVRLDEMPDIELGVFLRLKIRIGG
jgi:hypothetical protein